MKIRSLFSGKAVKKAPPKKAAPAFVSAARPVKETPILLPGNLTGRLNALRRRYRGVAIATGIAMQLAAIPLLLLVQAVCDWWLDLPWFARAGFLGADVVLLGLLYHQKLRGALGKKLSLTETALLIEKKWPNLRQCVIAAVQLGEGRTGSTRGSEQLVGIALEQARARTVSLDFSQVVSARHLSRWALGAGAALLLAGGVAAYGGAASVVLLKRIALLNVPLPTKTIVVPITRDLAVPVGSDVELSALAQGVIPTHGRVTITYAGSASQEIAVDVEPDKPGTFTFVVHNVQSPFRYSFSLNDGHGPEFNVIAKMPPTVTAIACEQTFPSYTGIAARKLAPTDLSLLVGSHLKVSATASESLKSATIILQGVTQTIEATIDSTGRSVTADIPIPVKDLTGFSIHLVGTTGVGSANETVYPIVLVPDNPPVVKMLEPTDDQETVTLRAKPVIAFDASDDYGLDSLTLNYEIVAPAIAGQEEAVTPRVETVPIKIHAPKEGTHYEQVVDIAAQTPAWHEGDTVNFWIEARDNNTATGPGVTKTDKKQFSIISVEAKEQEILEMLKQNAADINALSDAQQKVSNDVGETVPQK